MSGPRYYIHGRSLWLAGLFFCIGLTGTAQSGGNIYQHFTTETGLASNQVSSLCQDAEGYIWIATLGGLQRYDGYRFNTYREDLHNPDALQTDYINTVFEDSRHRLWVGAGNEAPYLLDRTTGKFYDFNAHCNNKDNLLTGIWKFLEDGKGDIWVSGKTGYSKLNSKTYQFENYNTVLGITGKIKPIVFERDGKGNIWVISTAGLACYDVREGRLYDKTHNPYGLQLFNCKPKIKGILFDDNNSAWLSAEDPDSIYRFDLRTGKMVVYALAKIVGNKLPVHRSEWSVNVVGKDQGGHILITVTSMGLIVYDVARDVFTCMPIDNEDPFGLHGSPEEFYNIRPLVDREGNVWMGTDKGLNLFSFRKKYFNYYGSASRYAGANSFPAYPAEGFLQTPVNGDIYVAYYSGYGGILRMDSNLQFKKRYLSVPGESLRNQLWCLYQDDNGKVWAPDQDRTILQLDPRAEKFSILADSALWGCINTMQRDANRDTWIGHWSKGLIKIVHQTHQIRSFSDPPASLTASVKNVCCLYLDGDSVLWAGTILQGLLRFDRRRNVFTDAYLFDQKNRGSISSNTVTCIIPYNEDTLLLATTTGIDIFDKRKRVFCSIPGNNTLTSTYVQSMMLDEQHRLWAACLNGFCKINIHTGAITDYDAGDGITCPNFENRPFMQLRNGRYLVPGSKGFMVFDPDSIGKQETPPDATITNFRVYDKGVHIESYINGRDPLELSYLDNNLNIEFSALQYSTPGKIRYSYQLEGVDKDWVASGKDQAARYNQLRSGHYLFKVKCTNRNGVDSRRITSLSIFIVPPFWNTWWFYAAMILLVISAIFVTTRWINNRKKEKELLQLDYDRKIAVMEMNTLRAQMNPHFIFNSLNSINTFILKNDQENATDYLNKFSRLVRLILDNSRTEWVLLENELKALELYIELETLRFDKPFSYAIHIDPAVAGSQVVVPPLIIQPYVENAIWHGLLHRKRAGGKIAIDIWKDQDALMMQVTDNGVGRAVAAKLESKRNIQHKSHGMKITAERLSVVNEVYKVNAAVTVTDLSAEGTKVSGTKVLLTIQYRTHAGINH